MGSIKLADGLCVKCADGKLKPCIGKREKALCRYHYRQEHRRSKKGKAEDVIYYDLKAQYLEENPDCQLMIGDVCTGKAVDIHHMEGHGGAYLDVSTYRGACRACHQFARDHPQFAYDHGIDNKRLIVKDL